MSFGANGEKSTEYIQSPSKHYKKCLFKYTKNFATKKNENFQIKNSDILHITAKNIDCGYALEPPRRGGSNAYPQSMYLSRNKKNNVYYCKPQFYYIKVGFKGVKKYIGMFSLGKHHHLLCRQNVSLFYRRTMLTGNLCCKACIFSLLV